MRSDRVCASQTRLLLRYVAAIRVQPGKPLSITIASHLPSSVSARPASELILNGGVM